MQLSKKIDVTLTAPTATCIKLLRIGEDLEGEEDLTV